MNYPNNYFTEKAKDVKATFEAELAEANATAESLAERVVDLEIALLEVSV